jgi:hypothetical protein
MNTNMWQRIQTVFLGITIISLIIALIQPIWQITTELGKVVLTPFYLLTFESGETGASELYTYIPYSLTAVLAVAAITIAILEIRKYDNRILQIKLGAFNTLILAGMMISAVAFATKLPDQYGGQGNYGLGLYLIFVAVICNWLAVRFIRRDEKLVRDADRIR